MCLRRYLHANAEHARNSVVVGARTVVGVVLSDGGVASAAAAAALATGAAAANDARKPAAHTAVFAATGLDVGFVVLIVVK